MIPAVIAKIHSMQNSFTMSENEISQYVINHTEDVITCTISTMAQKSGTSEASINRFCKKLGFKGFNSFKIALAQENFYNQMKQQTAPAAGESLLASVSRDYQHMLVNTSAMLDEDVLLRAVECMKQSSRIYLFALANTAFVAQEFEFKLTMAGISAKAVTDTVSMHIQASNVKAGDMVIVIAPTLLMRDIYQTVNFCKDRGAKIATITSYDSPRLNDLIDYKFVTSDKITAHNSISISNNLMFLYVVDVMYSILLDSDKSLRQKKLNSDAALNGNQMMDNYIYEY